MNNNENLNNVNNNSIVNNTNNQGMDFNPIANNNVGQTQQANENTVASTNSLGTVNNTEVNPVTNDFISNVNNATVNQTGNNNSTISNVEPPVTNQVVQPGLGSEVIQKPTNELVQPVPQNLNNQVLQNINNQPTNPGINNVTVQSQSNLRSTNQGNNKSLMIILIISVVVAIISVVVAVVVISKNNSTTVNDYEKSNGISQVNDTVEYNGFVINKKSGYTYKVDEALKSVFIYNDTTQFQLSFLPYSFNTLELQKEDLKTTLLYNGYSVSNMKTNEYSGKKVISFEVVDQNYKTLFFVYSLPVDNYSVAIYAENSSNTYDYNLINESIKLTNDITKSSGTFASEKSSDSISIPKVTSKVFEK